MAGIDNLKPYQWKPGQSGNPRGRPPTKLERMLKKLLEEEIAENGMPNVEALARAVLAEALGKAGCMERKAILDREYPIVERHEIEVHDADDSGLRARLAALTPRAETNGLDHHTNGAAEEEPS